MNKHLIVAICMSMLALSTAAFAHSDMRVISSGGSITEVIYALDKQDLIVAADSTSHYPRAAAALPKLGYFRQLSTEGILSFHPTHLIGAQATGPDTLFPELKAAGVEVSILGEQRDLAGLKQLISQVGEIVHAPVKAKELIEQIDSRVSQLKKQAQGLKPITALFILSDSDRGLTVAGANTVPQALFNDAGITNAAQQMRDYKVMDNESILAANPDIIFVASHRIRSDQEVQTLCQHPAIKATTAGQICKPVVMESSSALGLSPRYPEALEHIIKKVQAFHARG
ncbi:heme/hemin ABC transporter substrate-binding protein [Paraglaciecola sp. 2405UD69-4]|uniref:heme/hemin ABC transporter substrate-binding protein n=1 Tax=Paraglaciecola sp. 2405UD69-4 TaxID=3391836 RepID=UPI0039C99F07